MTDIRLDISDIQYPGWSGGRRRANISRPSETVYQKRKAWWIAHDFGEEASAWAAKWRFGRPKKVRGVKPGEKQSINDAIRLADRRVAEVKYRMRTFGETREKAIKHLDKELRLKDKREKVRRAFVEPGVSIYHRMINPNIFKVLS